MTISDLMTVVGVTYVGVSLMKMLTWNPNDEIKQISGSVPLWYDLKSSTISVDCGQVVWNARLARGLPYTFTIIKCAVGLFILNDIALGINVSAPAEVKVTT